MVQDCASFYLGFLVSLMAYWLLVLLNDCGFSHLDIIALKLGINWLVLSYHGSLVLFFSSFYYQLYFLLISFDSIDSLVCLDRWLSC